MHERKTLDSRFRGNDGGMVYSGDLHVSVGKGIATQAPSPG